MIKELFSALFPILFIFLCIGAAILWAKAIEEEYTTPPKKPNPPKFPMYTKEDLEFLHWLAKSLNHSIKSLSALKDRQSLCVDGVPPRTFNPRKEVVYFNGFLIGDFYHTSLYFIHMLFTYITQVEVLTMA